MPQTPEQLKSTIDSFGAPDAVKAQVWDIFTNSQDPSDLKTKLDKVLIPKEAKAKLWDMKAASMAATGVAAEKQQPESSVMERIFPTKPTITDMILGPGVSTIVRAGREGARALGKAADNMLESEQYFEDQGIVKPSAMRRWPANALKSTARIGEGLFDPKSVAMGVASLHPLGRIGVSTYMAGSGAIDVFSPKKADESTPDYLERVLLGASGIAAGAAGFKSSGKTPAQIREQRLDRATYAAGGKEGVNEAFRATIDDLDHVLKSGQSPVNRVTSVVDVKSLVDYTNDLFNNHFEQALKPFENDQVAPQSIADALDAEADKLPPRAEDRIRALRKEALKFRRSVKDSKTGQQRPWTLRDVQREWTDANKLWSKMANKTELGQSIAKANADELITDTIRKTSRDFVVDYLDKKYPGQDFRGLKLRQSSLLELKDALEKNISKVRAAQASESGKPLRAKESLTAGVGPGGVHPRVHGLQRLLPGMGVEKAANVAARKAFKKPGTGRGLKPLQAAPPQATPVRPNPMQPPPGASPRPTANPGGMQPPPGKAVIPPSSPTVSQAPPGIPGISKGALPQRFKPIGAGASVRPPVDQFRTQAIEALRKEYIDKYGSDEDYLPPPNETILAKAKELRDAQAKAKFSKPQGGHAGSGVTSVEELKRSGKNYVISKSGKVTYHGKVFDPGGIAEGSTHVTVMPDGSFRVNGGQKLTAMQEYALKQALKK